MKLYKTQIIRDIDDGYEDWCVLTEDAFRIFWPRVADIVFSGKINICRYDEVETGSATHWIVKIKNGNSFVEKLVVADTAEEVIYNHQIEVMDRLSIVEMRRV